MNALLTGGLVAAVLAAWSQVKAAATYLSSFVVIRARMDELTSAMFYRHITKEWKLLPSGNFMYALRYIKFTGSQEVTTVPFKLQAENSVYYKNGCLLLVSHADNDMLIRYLRGTLDLDKLMKRLITETDETDRQHNSLVSRFAVYSHVGRDKTFHPQVSGGNSLPSASPSSSSKMRSVDTAVDRSFMYESSNWIEKRIGRTSPFEHLYYSRSVEVYIKQAREWLNKRDWYLERLIPWRRGWLLHGPGGTGKTSLAVAVAQDLGLPVHQFFLSTLSDQEFIERWDTMSIPAMALFEDFDNVFHGRESVGKSLLTFDCVLNKISGAGTANGVFLVVTTNDITKIDPAMGVSMHEGISTRPGRIDTVIEVGALDESGRKKMALRILKDWPDLAANLVLENEGATPAQFQEICVQAAFTQLAAESEDCAQQVDVKEL